MNVKNLFLMLGIAALLASCSSEDVPQEPQENVKTITFSASLDQKMNSRAECDQMTRAIVEVYSDSAATQKEQRIEVKKGSDGKFTFTIPNLISGKKYTFLFWSDNPIDNQFDASDLKNVKQNNQHITSVAYSLATTLTPEEISQSGVQLKHAVAKISLQTTGALTTNDKLRIVYPRYKTFSVLTNFATGRYERGYYDICNNYNAGDVFCVAYIFGHKETHNFSIEYGGRPIPKDVNNVPINTNMHIILKSNFANIGLSNANVSASFDDNWDSNQTKDF